MLLMFWLGVTLMHLVSLHHNAGPCGVYVICAEVLGKTPLKYIFVFPHPREGTASLTSLVDTPHQTHMVELLIDSAEVSGFFCVWLGQRGVQHFFVLGKIRVEYLHLGRQTRGGNFVDISVQFVADLFHHVIWIMITIPIELFYTPPWRSLTRKIKKPMKLVAIHYYSVENF